MSQDETYKILQELGGFASITQIRDRALEKYPNYLLFTYVTNRLKKLEKKGYVRRVIRKESKGRPFWKIIKKLKVKRERNARNK